jgi:hypothetical protein
MPWPCLEPLRYPGAYSVPMPDPLTPVRVRTERSRVRTRPGAPRRQARTAHGGRRRTGLLALLTALVMALCTLPPASAVGPAPTEPTSSDPGVDLELERIGPTALTPDSRLTVTVHVTNTTDEELEDLRLDLRTRTSRVTSRETIAAWQDETGPDTGGRLVDDSSEIPSLGPGDSRDVTISVPADELGYDAVGYLWGTRRISVTAVDGDTPLDSLRTFTVWRPDDADATIRQSVLLPVRSDDPGRSAVDPEAYASSISDGDLGTLRDLALREDVDWMLDPSLLDPPRVPAGTATHRGDTDDSGQKGKGSAAPSDGDSAAPSDGDEEGAGSDGSSDSSSKPSTSSTPSTGTRYAATAASTEFAAQLTAAAEHRTVLGLPYAQADRHSLRAADATDLSRALDEHAQDAWDTAGIEPAGEVAGVPGAQASAKALTTASADGADVLMVPSTSLHRDPEQTVTPSSIGVLKTKDASVPVLAPDPVLSHEFSAQTKGTDLVRTRQLMLAQTATIASEQVTASRQVLIAPSVDDLDTAAAAATLDAFDKAPWIQQAPTSDLLDAAKDGSIGTHTQADASELYGLGRIDPDAVVPSGTDDDGHVQRMPDAKAKKAKKIPAGTLHRVQRTVGGLHEFGGALGDDAVLDVPLRTALSATSATWIGDEKTSAGRARSAQDELESMQGKIKLVPASGYNLVSDSAGVPITISNGLDTDITVRVRVSADRPVVRIGDPPLVKVPAGGDVQATVPVEAVANGELTLSSSLETDDGDPIGDTVRVPLRVNPAWENWTTLILVIAMGVLIVVGVFRARRTGSSTRAPATRDPEDPATLAHEGRSVPADESSTSATDERDGGKE